MIYKTFKEWEEGNYLEDLEPRKEAYTQQELDLIEMGWNYGVDAEREECAIVCEERFANSVTANDTLEAFNGAIKWCAAAIRARGDALTKLNQAAEDNGEEL